MVRVQARFSIAAVALVLLAVLAVLVATDLVLTRIEWDRHGSVQRARAEIEYPNLAPRTENSLSRTFGLARIRFDIDAELSVPTWYNASLFVLAGSLGVVAALRSRELRRGGTMAWALMSGGLLYLAADEATMLHELLGGDGSLGQALRSSLGLDFITFEWVIPAAIVLLAALPVLAPFFWRLPRDTLAVLALAALIYLGGAVALETYQGDYIRTHNIDSWGYHVLSATEETLEMAGVIVLIVGLLAHLQRHLQEEPALETALAGQVGAGEAGQPTTTKARPLGGRKAAA